MTYRERTKAVCASILLILKNATIVIPVIEGFIYTVWDLVKPEKKEKQNGSNVDESIRSGSDSKTVEATVIEPEEVEI